MKLFILAAALQAGVQADDVIDGRRPCVLPNPGDPDHPFEITDAVSRDVDTVRNMTVYSINCAYARLSQIVGLYRVVNMMYRMAQSPYLYLGQSESERTPIQPYASLATGANEMSAARHGVGRPDDRQPRSAHGAVLRRADHRPRRHGAVHAQRPGHPGARPRRRRRRRRHHEGRAHRGHRPPTPARRHPVGRQDRDPGGQHQRLVRGLHPAPDDGGVDRRPQRPPADAERPRVQRREP